VHQNNIIREVSRRYLAASQPSRIRRRRPWPSHSTICTSSPAPIERAQQLQVPVVISIVDAHGTETVTWRMPDALLVSSELAPKKAWTAVAMKTATHELSDAVQPAPRFMASKRIYREKWSPLAAVTPCGATAH
jgi:uncharacterized protein GlcG (DUF336 family)